MFPFLDPSHNPNPKVSRRFRKALANPLVNLIDSSDAVGSGVRLCWTQREGVTSGAEQRRRRRIEDRWAERKSASDRSCSEANGGRDSKGEGSELLVPPPLSTEDTDRAEGRDMATPAEHTDEMMGVTLLGTPPLMRGGGGAFVMRVAAKGRTGTTPLEGLRKYRQNGEQNSNRNRNNKRIYQTI